MQGLHHRDYEIMHLAWPQSERACVKATLKQFQPMKTYDVGDFGHFLLIATPSRILIACYSTSDINSSYMINTYGQITALFVESVANKSVNETVQARAADNEQLGLG